MSSLPLFDFAVREIARECSARDAMPSSSRSSASKGYPPRARRSHPPDTSRAAHRKVRGSGTLGAQQLAVLSLVRAHPGRTATRLAELSESRVLGADETARRYAISRRLAELQPPTETRPRAFGLVRGEREPGWRETRWWPVETPMKKYIAFRGEYGVYATVQPLDGSAAAKPLPHIPIYTTQGYGCGDHELAGSGDLALAILADHFGLGADALAFKDGGAGSRAWAAHQAFRDGFIARADRRDGIDVTTSDIERFLAHWSGTGEGLARAGVA